MIEPVNECAPAMEAPQETYGPVDLHSVERRTLLMRISELENDLAVERMRHYDARVRAEDMRQQRDEKSERLAQIRSIGPAIPLSAINEMIATMTLASGALIGRSALARRKLISCIATLLAFKDPPRGA